MEKTIEDLQIELEELRDKIDKKMERSDRSLSYREYMESLEPELSQARELSSKIRLSKPSGPMSPIPSYGNHMTLERFILNCRGGGFVDSDGSGNYATETEMSDISIYPSDIRSNTYRKDFTHVVWFNK